MEIPPVDSRTVHDKLAGQIICCPSGILDLKDHVERHDNQLQPRVGRARRIAVEVGPAAGAGTEALVGASNCQRTFTVITSLL